MSRNLIKLKENWTSYIMNNKLSDDTRPEIKEAWDRCIEMNVDYNEGHGHQISENELKRRLIDNENLIEIAKPIMENIFEIIKNTSFSIILTDKDGVLIHAIVNNNIYDWHVEMNFVVGTRWDEKNVGANAIGTSLASKNAIHMVGAEHYCLTHHAWTCSAAPIHDSLGNIIGCMNLSGIAEDENIHTFGVISTGAGIIEKQLDLINSYELMDKAFNSILDGLFVLDRNFKITHINDKMKKIFGMNKNNINDYDFKDIFNDINIVKEVFNKEKNILLSDYTINYGTKKIDCLINISPFKINNFVNGAVVFVKEAHKIRKVVSQIVGYKASYSFDNIVTIEEKMISIIKFAKKIARTDCTVLIQGESGTGKEVFAHAIHNYSNRKNGPFIAINCAALPKNLVESELFGYEKGSFTGALSEGKPGKFELANGGTIFFDEIGELPIEIQSTLLRVLDNQKVSRIGSCYERDIDVRIITATNRNLREEIEMKSFREDLFYRLNVININIMPLRERKKDILPLAEEFLKQLNAENKESEKFFSNEFKESLLKNYWKGNVRELQNHIQREYYISNDERIEGMTDNHDSEFDAIEFNNVNFQTVEKLCIIKALKDSKGNVIVASEKLKIGKSTIYRKIKLYNIDIKKIQNENN